MSTVSYEAAVRQWAIDRLRERGHEPARDYDPDRIRVRFDGYGGDFGTDATPESYANLDVRITAGLVAWDAEYELSFDANAAMEELIRGLVAAAAKVAAGSGD